MIGWRRRVPAARPVACCEPVPDTADWIGFRPGPETEALLDVLRARLRAAATAECEGVMEVKAP